MKLAAEETKRGKTREKGIVLRENGGNSNSKVIDDFGAPSQQKHLIRIKISS